MRRISFALAGLLLFSIASSSLWRSSSVDGPLCPKPEARSPLSEARLLALERENGCTDDDGEPAQGAWPDWRSATVAGGDVPPARVVADPYPTLHSVVVDAGHDRVFMSDPNRHALWSYERLAASKGREAVAPLTGIRGPSTGMMFVAGITVDATAEEIFTVDNDIGDRLMVFPYDAAGNVKPKRVLTVPHRAWGISIDQARDEMAISVEDPREIVIYKRDADRSDQPLRIIRGARTGLGDPHGLFYDGTNNEIVVANHGNVSGRQSAPGDVPRRRRSQGPSADEPVVGGRFEAPSITVYPGTAKGDVAPVRRIQGSKTGLNWPMALDVDIRHDEVAVANNGDSSLRVFRRTDSGDVAPVRVIKGALTGIKGPMGVAFDVRHDEIWVANYGDHTALVFARTATGNVAPKRILRNAPAGSPTVGFGNPGAVAYDSKRDEILVPN
jgi:DNA-binding beta-propeller fold protein YncE